MSEYIKELLFEEMKLEEAIEAIENDSKYSDDESGLVSCYLASLKDNLRLIKLLILKEKQ